MKNGKMLQIFPTYIYQQNVLAEGVITNELRSKVSQQLTDAEAFPQHPLENGRAQSTSVLTEAVQNLLHSNELRPLAVILLKHAQTYWNAIGYEKDDPLKIVECWANYHSIGGRTLEHNHSPMHINATCYLDVPEGSGALELINPLEYIIGQSPTGLGAGSSHSLHVKEGDLVIMPGWLRHRVPASQCEDLRRVITFNIMGDLRISRLSGLSLLKSQMRYYGLTSDQN